MIYVSADKKDEELFYLEQDPEIEGAMVSINPKTGEIYAMVGGFSYDKSFFNRAGVPVFNRNILNPNPRKKSDVFVSFS